MSDSSLCYLIVINVFIIGSILSYYYAKKVILKIPEHYDDDHDEDPELYFRNKFIDSIGLPHEYKMFAFLPVDILYYARKERHEKELGLDLNLANRLIRISLDEEIESIMIYRNGIYLKDYLNDCKEHWSKYRNINAPESIESAKSILIKYLKLIPSTTNTIRVMNYIKKYLECMIYTLSIFFFK